MIAVYAQLSVQAEEINRKLPDAKTASPVKRGDLERHFREGIRYFLIIDGEFQQSLAVSPNEILDILRAGGIVFGSSSIGALRAAELDQYGMIGAGLIYRTLKNQKIFYDDDLGHLYDQQTFEIFTLPRIEIDLVLKNEKLSKRMRKVLHYSELSLPNLEEFLKSNLIQPELNKALKAVRRLFEEPNCRQKNRDAVTLLEIAKT